jgi:hypothetical protein
VATFGNTSVSFNQFYQNVGSNNQVGTRCQATQDGTITDLTVYMAGDGSGAETVLCVWDDSGNLLAQTAPFTSSVGSFSVGGQANQTAKLLTPLQVTNGTFYYLGFWRKPTHTVDYSTRTGSGTTHKQGSNASAPTSLNTTTVTEVMQAFATYAAGGAHVTQADASEPVRLIYVTQGDGSKPQRLAQVKNVDTTYHIAQ